jgi:tripartite-type tricarboxylate transporter receptor subunit TctC
MKALDHGFERAIKKCKAAIGLLPGIADGACKGELEGCPADEKDAQERCTGPDHLAAGKQVSERQFRCQWHTSGKMLLMGSGNIGKILPKKLTRLPHFAYLPCGFRLAWALQWGSTSRRGAGVQLSSGGRTMKKTALTLATGALLAGLTFTGAALAQDYPTKPVTVVVPFAAGGPTDTVARLVAEVMSADLGQQVVIQNVGGAGGTLGAGQVATAPNDGYTLLLHHIGMSTAPTLYRSLPFDPTTDFAPIGLITSVPMTLVARKDFEPNTMAELLEYVKANGENITYAHAGIGSASQLCGMLLMDAVDTQMTTVPYQGSGPAMTDIIGSQIDMICDQTTNTTSQIQAGEVKAYAVTSTERLGNLPDLPTTAEGGLELEIGVWHGLYAPAGTDPAIIARLETSLQAALTNETVVSRFAELGTVPVTAEEATPDGLAQTLASQIELWRGVIEAAGVYAD